MTTNNTVPPPPWLADAWTADDAARHLNWSTPRAEMFMDRIVMHGLATRVTCGDRTVYVPVEMRLDRTEGQS